MGKKLKKLKKVQVLHAEPSDKGTMGRSPVPQVKKIVMLSFPDAIREVLNGKRLTRVSWNDANTYIVLREEFLMIHIGGGFHQLITSLGDMEGIDWYVLPEAKTN